MRHLLVILACAAAVLAQEVAVEKALVHVRVDDYARLQAERLFENSAPVRQLKACRILQPYTLLVSGAVISSDGEILTPALHPRASLRILVTMHDGVRHLAELKGTDPESGLALVKIPVKTRHFLQINEEPLTHMQEVRVLGHAGDELVQGLGKIGRVRQPVEVQDFYTGRSRLCAMTTAVTFSALYPRMGALCLDEKGALCGLRVSGMPPGRSSDGKKTFEGHFLVPSPRIARIIADLREHGRVPRVNFGVRLNCVPDSLRAHMPELPACAAAIERIQPGFPAEAAGLRANDVIVALDGETFRDALELFEKMSAKPAGKPVRFDVLRKGEKLSFEATPVERD